MATVGVTAAGATVMVLGGAQMVLAGGSLLLWQVGIWAQSPTAMQWGNAVNVWATQYSAWLWGSQTTSEFVGYHRTSSVHVPSIRQGINPPTGANFAGKAQLGEGFYVTPDYEAAELFARWSTLQCGGEPIVLRVQAEGFSQMSGTSVPRSLWWQTPAEYITNYDYLEAPISGMEQWSQIKFNPRVYDLLRVLR